MKDATTSFVKENGGILVILATISGLLMGYMEWRVDVRVAEALEGSGYATVQQMENLADKQDDLKENIGDLKHDISRDISDLRTTIDNLIRVLLEDNGRRA